jgi:molybdate transport system permease protein
VGVALTVLLGIFLGLPVAVLIVRSIVVGALQVAITNPSVLDALQLSLITTAISLGLTVLIATPVSLLLARRQFRGKTLLETVVDLPIVLPPSVAGLALLLTFGRRGLFGDELAAIGISLPFTTAAVILAQMFVAMPFYIRAARAGFMGVEREVEDAGRMDGASEWQLTRTITIPLAGTALASGLVMTWARALGEFGATIMFAGNFPGSTQTLPLVVYDQFNSGDVDASVAASAILVIAAFAVLVAVRGLGFGRFLDFRAA